MAKRNKRKKKQPKQTYKPSMEKTPKAVESVARIPTSSFSWRIHEIDLDGKWGWLNAELQCLLQTIIPKLHDYESMTWAEIEGSGSHFIDTDTICKGARDRLEEINKDDSEELFSLRISARQRVWGVRSGTQLNVLWWDPEHEVCPSRKKHT